MKFNLPVILLKSLVILPFQEVRIELNNEISKKTVAYSSKCFENKILVVCPIDQMEEEPEVEDLPKIGVIGKIKTKIELPNGNLRIVIKGLERVDVIKYCNDTGDEDILISNNMKIELVKYDSLVKTATLRKLLSILDEYINNNHDISNSILSTVKNLDDLEKVTDIITSFLPFSINKRLEYMNEVNAIKRAEQLIQDLNVEIEVISLEEKIDNSIKEKFANQEKEIIIKEKIKELNNELGVSYNRNNLCEQYYSQLNKLHLDIQTTDKLTSEIRRLEYTSDNNPEISIIHNYLEWILSLPWNKFSKDETNINNILKTLDKNHYGLLNAKNKILEYIVAKKVNKNINAPIICLVGPPGTGKTTFSKSIAESLNRKFYKISVGGLNDSSELIGHSRTYLGANPGKIITGLRKCKTSNPVLLIDEVDKMVKDYKGDPAAVLLDILDNEQNKKFIDAYIEEPFDLSNVLFILTANSVDTIPGPLRDRLDIIYLNSYSNIEKLDIVKKHLLPRILEDHNMKNKIKFNNKALMKIINDYTSEAGLRDLERKLTTIIRKVLIEYDNEFDNINVSIKDKDIDSFLGQKTNNDLNSISGVGIVNSLAVSSYGGVLLKIECKLLNGTGDNVYTGNLEKNLNESINVSLGYILGNKNYNISEKTLKNKHFHLNMLNSEIKKDGPSGGVAITTAILSCLKNKVIKNDVSFTGEITLNGYILKVGGIKEKVIASYNNNIKKIYIPYGNLEDLDNIPNEIKKNIEIKLVKNYEEIYQDIF